MFDQIATRIVSLLAAAVIGTSNITSVYAEEFTTTATEYTTAQTVTTTESTETTSETTDSETAAPTDTTSSAVSDTFITTAATAATTPEPDTTELTYQNVAIYPDETNADKTVKLDGMMPEGAAFTAVDVTAEHNAIAAYDITITDMSGEEFQPDESNPILVEIADPVIPLSSSVELWHIRDDGIREQITNISVEEGRISFFAAGFSVYEIVQAGEAYEPTAVYATSIDELVATDDEGHPVPFVMGIQ